MKLFKLDWDLLEDHEKNDFVELGWTEPLWEIEKTPNLYAKKWIN